MIDLVARRSGRLIFAGILSIASISFAVAFGYIFPDQTWSTLNAAKTLYAEIVSRMVPVPTGAARGAEEDKIREAVFLELIGSNTSRRICFLSLDGSDPTDSFMFQFADLAKVKKLSKAEFTSRGWLDISTGERGEVLSIRSIKWFFGDRVEVEAGVFCGTLCGSGGTYEVVKCARRWKVESYRKKWDS